MLHFLQGDLSDNIHCYTDAHANTHCICLFAMWLVASASGGRWLPRWTEVEEQKGGEHETVLTLIYVLGKLGSQRTSGPHGSQKLTKTLTLCSWDGE